MGMAGPAAAAQQGLMGQLGLAGMGVGLDGQPQGIPRGHGRRHSVNVINKSNSQPGGFGSISGFDSFDDGFMPPAALGGHSRQASRADAGWRTCNCASICCFIADSE